MPKGAASLLHRIERKWSIFRKAESVPCSSTEIDQIELRTKSQDNSGQLESVNNLRRGNSVSYINNTIVPEKMLNNKRQYCGSEINRISGKFTKRYIKMKIGNLFRSNSKINYYSNSATKTLERNSIYYSSNNTDADCNKSNNIVSNDDMADDALRNLSFTAAIIANKSQNPKTETEYIDYDRPIPLSTLRFWRKPSEEKLKASHRRIQENLHRSSELLLRINPTIVNNKHPSELSLFYDDGIYQPDNIKMSSSDIRRPVIVAGYDKALDRYQNIINQSKHISRRDKTLSLAYETESNGGNNRLIKMTTSQSSNNMCNLIRCNSTTQCFNSDMKRSFLSDSSQSPSIRGRYSRKDHCCQNPKQTAFLAPPPYENNLSNKFTKMKVSISKSTSSYSDIESSVKSKKYALNYNQRPPKPPPRSDSLIRSFELICQNLNTSISEPRGDSFKMFKCQRDYESWLRNLPYNNPNKIANLLKMRSKITRRQCVSELLDEHMENVDSGKRRRYSWPLLTNASISFEQTPNRRASSLSRVKKKKEADDKAFSLESPSLRNYSRLYSLRNSEQRSTYKTSDLELIGDKASVPISMRSPIAIARMKRAVKYRYSQMSNSKMTESCHESGSYSII